MVPSDTLKIAIAQLDPILGDVAGNLAKAREALSAARMGDADLIVFPELFLTGHPPGDLALDRDFERVCRRAVEDLARDTEDGGPGVVIGTIWREGEKLRNALVLIDRGTISATNSKVELSGGGLFDERHIFDPGPLPGPVHFRGVRLGLAICEDMLAPDVPECLAETGAELLIVANASPYWRGKLHERFNLAALRVAETGLPLVYANLAGAQDGAVYDGASFGLQPKGALAFQMPGFVEAIAVTHWRREENGWVCTQGPRAVVVEGAEADYTASMLSLRAYVEKNDFPGVVLGLSGGLDSAFVAALAVDALGAERVRCVMLPSLHTSPESLALAAECARRLGLPLDDIPIDPVISAMDAALSGLFAGRPSGLVAENLQARARGTLLMALSNGFGSLLLATGNRSELLTGYATLYGDMAGGFNPVRDLYKTQLRALSELRNCWRPADARGPEGEVIPAEIIARAPSAELAPGQRDEDSLPPYEVLDAVLELLVDQGLPQSEIAAAGHDSAAVRRIAALFHASEHKRRQAAPGTLVARASFRAGFHPINHAFRDLG